MAGESILIVEDEGILAIELAEKLERLGYNVAAAASSGEEAIEMAAKHKPDLILMDIVLKGEMDGIAAARKIHSTFKVPIIYLTAYAGDDTVKRAKLTEPFGYLVKPYNDRELQIALEMALYRHAMDKLRENNHWLETVVMSMGDAVMTTDNRGCITLINPSAEMLTGLKHEDAVGKKLEDVIRIVDEETWTQVTGIVSKTLANKFVVSGAGNNLLNTTDGKDVPVEYVASPITDAHGAVMGTVLILKDLTSQRNAEIASKVRDVAMASSINALCITDINRIIKYANAPFYELWGYRPAEVIGRSASEICKMNIEISEIETTLSEKGKWVRETWTGETSAQRRDGTNFFLKLSVSNICDRLGRPIYIAYSFIDITNLKRAQEDLKKYIIKLQRTDVKTDELAEALSLNLKSCYEMILKLYALLSKEIASDDDEIAKCLDETKESIDKVCEMVEELELCSLPYSLYISLIALYQLRVEGFGKNC